MEATRDAIYQRYKLSSEMATMSPLEACIAMAVLPLGSILRSLVSLFYGEGDLKETLKIAVLAGWDADNPAATWGGLLGYTLGRRAIEAQFGQPLSDQFNIHRTRKGFPNNGIDSFCNMAKMGLEVSERVKANDQAEHKQDAVK